MFPHHFLSKIAQEHELSPEQEEVFIMRLGENKSYEEIAQQLGTSADACLKRMGQVYKKLNVSGSSRGKENRLRISLNQKLAQQPSKEQDKNQSNSSIQQENFHRGMLASVFANPQEKPRIYQNLPAREYTLFVGRNQEINRLIELLDRHHGAHLISVDGIGGVGKTTLVLEAAYRCANIGFNLLDSSHIPFFQAIIFTSAKQNYLTAMGVLPRLSRERTLRDICLEIARTLEMPEIANIPISEQIQVIRLHLAQIPTLLIVDNLETIEDKQEVLAFLYDLPPSVKVVITTREQALFVPIRLSCLSADAGLRLIEHEAAEKGINLTKEESRQLFTRVSGIPAAIIYAIGQIGSGYLLPDVLSQITDNQSDVAKFCFLGSVAPLRQTPPHYLLMGLSLCIHPVSREALIHIAFTNADPTASAQGLAKLQQLSLVHQQQGYYGLLPLTREYSLGELAAHGSFEREARDRWVNWYVNFSEDCGGSNWQEWHFGYSRLDREWENVRAVLEWCISQGRYADVRSLWQHLKGYIHTRGYWDERLDWANWLISAAKQAGDWFVCVEIMSDRAATLVRLRQPSQLEEAENLLQEAWNLRHHQTIKFQLELASNMAILYIHLNQLEQAQAWLEKELTLLTQSSLPAVEQQQQQVHIDYYLGQIFYKQGEYEQAQIIFEQALNRAETVKWQRGIAAIHNWLADIAIKQENLHQARQLLDFSLPMALNNKDKRSIAFHQATYAKLEQLSGNISQAKTFARQAADAFTSIKMTVEAQQMYDLLSLLAGNLHRRDV